MARITISALREPKLDWRNYACLADPCNTLDQMPTKAVSKHDEIGGKRQEHQPSNDRDATLVRISVFPTSGTPL